MKASLMYDDIQELRLALNAGKYWSALWDFNEAVRSMRKYGLPEDIKTPFAVIEEINRRWRTATEGIDWEEVD